MDLPIFGRGKVIQGIVWDVFVVASEPEFGRGFGRGIRAMRAPCESAWPIDAQVATATSTTLVTADSVVRLAPSASHNSCAPEYTLLICGA